jgi:hypothetical protein
MQLHNPCAISCYGHFTETDDLHLRSKNLQHITNSGYCISTEDRTGTVGISTDSGRTLPTEPAK